MDQLPHATKQLWQELAVFAVLDGDNDGLLCFAYEELKDIHEEYKVQLRASGGAARLAKVAEGV